VDLKILKALVFRSEEIGVERKMEISYLPDQPVRLTVLGAPQYTVAAQMTTLAGRRANLRLQNAVAHGAAVRIDLNDSLLLGEVSTCIAEADGFVATVGVEEAIPSLSDLAKLVSAVMSEARPVTIDQTVRQTIAH